MFYTLFSIVNFEHLIAGWVSYAGIWFYRKSQIAFPSTACPSKVFSTFLYVKDLSDSENEDFVTP